MLEHWFIVVNQKMAKVFTEVSAANRLKQIEVLDNPLGRERNRNLVKKQAGSGVKSVGRGAVHYSRTKRHDPHEEASLQFASKIAQYLEKEWKKKSFKTLTVVAEPHFLGKIKAAMDPKLKQLVLKWVGKDLQKTPQKRLAQFLLPSDKKSTPRSLAATAI